MEEVIPNKNVTTSNQGAGAASNNNVGIPPSTGRKFLLFLSIAFIAIIIVVVIFIGVGGESGDLGEDTLAGETEEVGESGVVLPIIFSVSSSAGDELKIATDGDIDVGSLKGSYNGGEAYVCVSDDGTIFAKESACS